MTTLKERVQAAFRFEEVQPVPYTVWYDQATMEKLNGHYGSADWQARIQDHILRITIEYEPTHDLGGGRFRDLYGTVWQRGDPVHMVEPALKQASLRGVEIPCIATQLRQSTEPETGARPIIATTSFAGARKMCEEQGGKVFTAVGFGTGIFERAWMMRGYENFFTDLLESPAFAHELLDRLTESHLELLDALLELPCDGVILNDDYGDQRGVVIGPRLWRAFVKPRLARLYERIHNSGKMTLHHSCGGVFDIAPDLIEAGLDVLQSLQPEAMPVYELKKRYGKNLRLWGGLGTQRLLPFGTPAEIRAEVRRLKRELGRGGGYVFSSSKPIMQEVPLENAVAFLEETVGWAE